MPSNEQHRGESVPHSLCSAFGMIGSQMTSHQSLVRPLPNADIAEHRVSYTLALLGLCLQSEQGEEKRGGGVLSHCGPACQDGKTKSSWTKDNNRGEQAHQQDDSFKDEF